MFVERGYLATTIADVAAHAGVSVPTVYKAFATKGALAEHAYPAADGGRFEPVLSEQDPRRALALYAALTTDELARTGAIAAAVHAGATAGDPELQALAEVRDRERARAAGRVARHVADAGALRDRLGVGQARDVLWFLGAPESYLLLVERRGWSHARLERWLAEAMATALLG